MGELVRTGGGLRALRVAAGLNIDELGERALISPSTLKRWERGEVSDLAGRAPIELLARALGVTPTELRARLGQSDDPSM